MKEAKINESYVADGKEVRSQEVESKYKKANPLSYLFFCHMGSALTLANKRRKEEKSLEGLFLKHKTPNLFC